MNFYSPIVQLFQATLQTIYFLLFVNYLMCQNVKICTRLDDVINEPFTKITKIQLWTDVAAMAGGWRHKVRVCAGVSLVTDTVALNITALAKQFIAEARGRAGRATRAAERRTGLA